MERVHQPNLQIWRQNRRIGVALSALLVGSLVGGSSGFAQLSLQDGAKLLDRAEHRYYQSHFNEALQIAEICLANRNLPEELEIRAHTIIAKAAVAKRNVDRAEEELRKILEINPKATLDPDVEPSQVIKLFEKARKEKEKGLEQPKPLPPSQTSLEGSLIGRPKERKGPGWFSFFVGYAVATGAAVATVAIILDARDRSLPPTPAPPKSP